MLQYRFNAVQDLAGHSLGNLMLAAMTDITGDFVTGSTEVEQGACCTRTSACLQQVKRSCLMPKWPTERLCTGESNIPKAGQAIKRVFIEPADVEPLRRRLKPFSEADAILDRPRKLIYEHYSESACSQASPEHCRLVRS